MRQGFQNSENSFIACNCNHMIADEHLLDTQTGILLQIDNWIWKQNNYFINVYTRICLNLNYL
jgi:hypothetical protein